MIPAPSVDALRQLPGGHGHRHGQREGERRVERGAQPEVGLDRIQALAWVEKRE